MAQKLNAGMPDHLQLDNTFTLRWAALDPNTGAPVSGVTLSNTSLVVQQITPGGPTALETDLFKIAPLFVPLPIDGNGG